eukprot:2750680-Rhodomonas_salina.1
MTLDCHVNVVVCHNTGCIGYLYKYIYKPPDQALFGFGTVDSRNGELKEVDELEGFMKGRWLSASEGAWRFLGFRMYQQSPTVKALSVHED